MRWVWLTLLLLLAFVVAAFTIQNSSFEAKLQLDLGVAAWRLASPVSVPVLMWTSFAVGAVVPALVLIARNARLNSRIRQLEQEIALGGGRKPDPWAGA
jgi:hypothetical protein